MVLTIIVSAFILIGAFWAYASLVQKYLGYTAIAFAIYITPIAFLSVLIGAIAKRFI